MRLTMSFIGEIYVFLDRKCLLRQKRWQRSISKSYQPVQQIWIQRFLQARTPNLLTLRQHYMQTGSGSNLKGSEWTKFVEELDLVLLSLKLKNASSWKRGRTLIRPLFCLCSRNQIFVSSELCSKSDWKVCNNSLQVRGSVYCTQTCDMHWFFFFTAPSTILFWSSKGQA